MTSIARTSAGVFIGSAGCAIVPLILLILASIMAILTPAALCMLAVIFQSIAAGLVSR